ncbi:hypothetical protein LTR78_001642 [Recurvomyces mirabilis]|uniref:RNA polymerase II subunit B1 CTD phosphatase RPAP2 homolog n=1 Tax=Recurvomyces mirabilis TaxID=574656 RepID=A0AAE0WUC9_9PEZI|nr:hypothetical protein LTR78_001642 [Recurvomyces mirabilis]KAK5151788.1 hypothetical protein LTS14_008920 [Recurvomyces mirabilis]
MAFKVPVKSILKQPGPRPDEAEAKSARDQKNYTLALQHARKIQAQKDWQIRIVNAIQVLLDYPTTSHQTGDEVDASKFIVLIQPFQPSDLDALIEERVVDGKCGWPLCSNEPRSVSLGKDAEWKVGKFKMGFCSNACAKKMAFVKTQLSEIPVWERDPGISISITLPDVVGVVAPVTKDDSSVPNGNYDVANAIHELALERGEKATSFRPNQVMLDQIVEKAGVVHKPLSGVHGADVSSTAIEGYEPRVKTKVGFVDEDEEGSEDGD